MLGLIKTIKIGKLTSLTECQDYQRIFYPLLPLSGQFQQMTNWWSVLSYFLQKIACYLGKIRKYFKMWSAEIFTMHAKREKLNSPASRFWVSSTNIFTLKWQSQLQQTIFWLALYFFFFFFFFRENKAWYFMGIVCLMSNLVFLSKKKEFKKPRMSSATNLLSAFRAKISKRSNTFFHMRLFKL